MGGLLAGLLIPLGGTVLGASFVFFMRKEMSAGLQKVLLGFASGVMVAASVWSLLIPGIEMTQGNVVPVTAGLLAGFAFLLLIDYITPHLHPAGGEEGPKSRLSKTAKLALAVTIHNLPEGMAVGVALAGAMLYVVVEELIPETSQGDHSNVGTIGFAIGFALMMVLDVVLG